MKIRARDCRNCAHLWVAPVVMSSNTSNISGEKTQFCPKCGSKAVNSGPQQDTAELVSDTAAVLTLNTQEHAALSSLLNAAMSAFAGCAGGALHGVLGQINEVDPFAMRREKQSSQVRMLTDWFEQNFDEHGQGALQVQLDDLVHDIVSKSASRVNNDGIWEQLNFIFTELGSDAQEAISAAWKDWAKKHPLPLGGEEKT